MVSQPKRRQSFFSERARSASVYGSLLVLSSWGIASCATPPAGPFYVKPYLQLGDNPKLSAPEHEELLWLSTHLQDKFTVEVKSTNDRDWKSGGAVSQRPVPATGVAGLNLFTCVLSDLKPGEKFDYRVKNGDELLFQSTAVARKSKDQPYRFAVFGDCGAGTIGQKKIAYQCYSQHPDFFVIPGDIVYGHGRFVEYMMRFFPVYAAEMPAIESGAPLISSSMLMPVLGNHDVGNAAQPGDSVLERDPDGAAYFYLYDTPLNGPARQEKEPGTPRLGGTADTHERFMKSAGKRFPTMANYSFDYGNSHWLMLDGNSYTDWSRPAYRQWVENDLAGAKDSTWKFVAFHQPGFSVDTEHANEQRMRLLSDIFQKAGVDLVFSGHAHNYQRTYPMHFNASRKDGAPVINLDGTVSGAFEFDKSFDGAKNSVARGVIYIVTGAGGAPLYEAQKEGEIDRIFLNKFEGQTHSFTTIDVDGTTLKTRQISEDGKILDTFKLSKEPAMAEQE